MEVLLIQDTREQRGLGPFFKNSWQKGTLEVGDYSVAGLENRISIERKSLADLLGSLTHDRKRFEKELAKTRSFDRFFVVVEGLLSTILFGRFNPSCVENFDDLAPITSMADPRAIWESIAAFNVRYCPFIFAENQEVAAALVESILLKYAREFYKATEIMVKAGRRMKR